MAVTDHQILDKKKTHRERNAGRKANKKKDKKSSEHVQELTDKQRNPKAYAINSAVRAERRFRRKQNLDMKKTHIPVVDRTPIEPPPILVAVVGPDKVGKTTLMNNLIKSFTKSTLTNIQGPVTLVTGKRRRITLIECNNDVNCMIDIAKVADIVLLLCDARSKNFNMDFFEFLNICQVHGMPRIMGVLTHLDMLKNTQILKARKKELKDRFWKEIYKGAKLFYLSGIVHGEYLRNEITNLSRFISIMKFRPITWRSTHSYLLADRCEDLTNQEKIRRNYKTDRNVSLYGYMRGIPLMKESTVHLAGVGDYKIHEISYLPDPCPLPDALKKRSLLEKERLIYAPFSGVGGIVYDKDAVYVELGGSHSHHQNNDSSIQEATETLVTHLLDTKQTLDTKLAESEMQIFSNSVKIRSKDVELELSVMPGRSEQPEEYLHINNENEEFNNLRQKHVQVQVSNLMKLVYGVFENEPSAAANTRTRTDPHNEIGYLFKVVRNEQKFLQEQKDVMNSEEMSLLSNWGEAPSRNWLESEHKQLIDNCFVTGKWADTEDAAQLLQLDDLTEDDGDSDVFGDFEDLETGEKHENKVEKTRDVQNDGESLAEKKRRLKEKFDAEYDKEDEKNTFHDDLKISAENQSQLNRSVFEEMSDEMRVQLEGFRAGMYVRIEFQNVPYEFVDNFNPTYPVVVGGLNLGEENIGYVNVKIKKHRWYERTLKTQDPFVLSLGWRRFQTIPLFSKLEDDLKFRYLKYTPDHVTCNAHFWGPVTPQGTGCLAIQDCTDDPSILKRGFRIAATGAVQELDKSTQIMKKLKLVGQPFKIYKKTAYIKGMFNTGLEVAKFEGAKIKTVSGIRGMIKKATGKPEGSFRATFEDKIVLSDIVFCRTWYKVDVPKLYNPITNLLLNAEHRNKWSGMKTIGQLKREQGVRMKPNSDSLYTGIDREHKVFKPLVIPKALQKVLPYRDKPKFTSSTQQNHRVAVVREPEQQQVVAIMRRLKTNYLAKQRSLKTQTSARMEARIAEINSAKTHLQMKQRQSKKEACRIKSRTALAKERKENRQTKQS